MSFVSGRTVLQSRAGWQLRWVPKCRIRALICRNKTLLSLSTLDSFVVLEEEGGRAVRCVFLRDGAGLGGKEVGFRFRVDEDSVSLTIISHSLFKVGQRGRSSERCWECCLCYLPS